jgi:hypothetical protein
VLRIGSGFYLHFDADPLLYLLRVITRVGKSVFFFTYIHSSASLYRFIFLYITDVSVNFKIGELKKRKLIKDLEI